jgi:hypothetical protein
MQICLKAFLIHAVDATVPPVGQLGHQPDLKMGPTDPKAGSSSFVFRSQIDRQTDKVEYTV